ncbi:hypothetical protein HDU67_005696, partial [Dinochytrium kinnereticum]
MNQGYVGRESSLRALVNLCKKLKTINPTIQIIVDPVMGDDGRMYVPEEVLPIYRDEVLRFADVITPNGFEA